MTDFDAFSTRIQIVVDHKLETACKICGISVDDTTSGKKHINVFNGDGYTTYVWAEEKLALVRILFNEKLVKITRIRRSQFLKHKLKKLLAKIRNHGRTDR